MVYQDPPESTEMPEGHGTNGDLVGDMGREVYNPHANDVDSDHDVAGWDWDGDVGSL